MRSKPLTWPALTRMFMNNESQLKLCTDDCRFLWNFLYFSKQNVKRQSDYICYLCLSLKHEFIALFKTDPVIHFLPIRDTISSMWKMAQPYWKSSSFIPHFWVRWVHPINVLAEWNAYFFTVLTTLQTTIWLIITLNVNVLFLRSGLNTIAYKSHYNNIHTKSQTKN